MRGAQITIIYKSQFTAILCSKLEEGKKNHTILFQLWRAAKRMIYNGNPGVKERQNFCWLCENVGSKMGGEQCHIQLSCMKDKNQE